MLPLAELLLDRFNYCASVIIMVNAKAEHGLVRHKKTLVFAVGLLLLGVIGFSDLFCKNCRINDFAVKLPQYEKIRKIDFVDVTKETLNHFNKENGELFEIAMIEADIVHYTRSNECSCMIVFSETHLSNYGPIGSYLSDTWIRLIFEIRQNKIVPTGAMLRTVGL